MAKNTHSFFKLQGTIGGLCFVQSRTYGAHIRAARGTVRKAVCNEALTKNHQRTILLNDTARPVYHALKQCSGFFREGQLWQRILGRLRKAGTNEPADLIAQLEGLEINSQYPLNRLLDPGPIELTFTRQRLKVSFGGHGRPVFKRIGNKGYYRFEITVIYPGGKEDGSRHYSHATEWVPVTETVPRFRLTFSRPRAAERYLICLKLQGREKPSSADTLEAQGMRVMRAGVI